MNALAQMRQTCLRSSLCVSLCFASALELLNILPHMGQLARSRLCDAPRPRGGRPTLPAAPAAGVLASDTLDTELDAEPCDELWLFSL